MKKNFAFTLAEVLIVLGIIGIVAESTIPVLVQKTNDMAMKVAWKKAFAELSQVNQELNSEYGGTYTDECESFDDACLRSLFVSKIRVLKQCSDPINEGCQASSTYLNGLDVVDNGAVLNWAGPVIITADGVSVKFRFHYN